MPLLICTRLSKPRRPRHGPVQPYASSDTSTSPGRKQALELVRLRLLAQIESGAGLAECHLAGFVPTGWIDARDVGAESGQKPCRDRTRQDGGEIEDANPPQRSIA